MSGRISGRSLVSVVTLAFLVIVLFFARHEIERAWQLLSGVNIWILLLLVPLQFVSYFAAGEMIFSYLKRKGHIDKMSSLMRSRLALEMNFVNHVLPSGGVSGISYMGWRLKHFGVSASRSTTGQLVRMVSAFGSYATLLLIALILMIFDGNINRFVAGASAVLVVIMLAGLIGVIYLFNHERRFSWLARRFVATANKGIKVATFGRSKKVFNVSTVTKFFADIRDDYLQIRANKDMLLIPYLWGLVFNVVEVALFYVTFLALGHPINPAPIVIAYGLAGVAGFFVITPGGAGAYEAIMVSFLALAGVNPGVGLAAILLTRVILMLGTIAAGYTFYQQAIIKHGKQPVTKL